MKGEIKELETEIIRDNERSRKKKPKRPSICKICNAKFKRLEHLTRHERSHTLERPFGCDICPATFARKDLLVRHKRTCNGNRRPRQRRASNAVKVVVNGEVGGNGVAGGEQLGNDKRKVGRPPKGGRQIMLKGAGDESGDSIGGSIGGNANAGISINTLGNTLNSALSNTLNNTLNNTLSMINTTGNDGSLPITMISPTGLMSSNLTTNSTSTNSNTNTSIISPLSIANSIVNENFISGSSPSYSESSGSSPNGLSPPSFHTNKLELMNNNDNNNNNNHMNHSPNMLSYWTNQTSYYLTTNGEANAMTSTSMIDPTLIANSQGVISDDGYFQQHNAFFRVS